MEFCLFYGHFSASVLLDVEAQGGRQESGSQAFCHPCASSTDSYGETHGSSHPSQPPLPPEHEGSNGRTPVTTEVCFCLWRAPCLVHATTVRAAARRRRERRLRSWLKHERRSVAMVLSEYKQPTRPTITTTTTPPTEPTATKQTQGRSRRRRRGRRRHTTHHLPTSLSSRLPKAPTRNNNKQCSKDTLQGIGPLH